MTPTTAKSTKPDGAELVAAEDGRFSIKPLLKLMAEKKASDLFFTSNSPVKIKIEGLIYPINKQVLNAEAVRDIAYGLMSAEQLEHFQNELEIDFAISEPGVGRFRAAVFYQRGYPAMVLRYISVDTPKLANAGVTRGCNPPRNDRFCPDDYVTRGQMAAFLVRAGLTD